MINMGGLRPKIEGNWPMTGPYLSLCIYKWSSVIHDIQSAEISQEQDGRNIYAIMKTMCLHPSA